MSKAVSVGIGIGIVLIALAVIILVPEDTDVSQDESPSGVQLSDEVKVVAEDTKSYDVNISEGLDVGDENP